MERIWTEEQKKVISLRNRNILVSAAAGSGKTAVLVERIIRKLTDPQKPVDIDRLLIMTFTRAAAGEMKERIAKALEQALYEDPDNENLQKQSALIHTAQITTIDGFCGYLLRNYFHLIGLDPGYRVADEGELKLLREDVLEEILEESYASKEESFLEYVECYAAGKSDDEIREAILKVYDCAMSHPDPKEWLKEAVRYYETESPEALRETKTMQLLWEAAEEELREAERLAKEAKEICRKPGGPWLYEEAIDSDLLTIRDLLGLIEKKAYDTIKETLSHVGFMRLSTKKAPDVEPELKEAVKELRDTVKETLKNLESRMFPSTEEQILITIKCCRKPMEALAALVQLFMERFAAKKREKNLLDFTDMEHFALQILMEKQADGSMRMSRAAQELSEKYDEVMVDEYQDSNLIQEFLTTCVSGWVNQRKNIFMVGDVKQSIYRFRLARPELFMEKYHRYSLEDGEEQRIDLHKNFRSRPEVLESINFIFRQIMGEDLGGIAYDDAAALYPGAVFPEGDDRAFRPAELLLVEKDGEELREEPGNENVRELEALAIAHRIKEMVGKERIADAKTGGYRPVEYGDIVVLLRTASGYAEAFAQVFDAEGIPSYTALRTGYFSAMEIMTVLNYLRICDNPLQDIPLTSVLRSPMVGCTAEELASIRCARPKAEFFYECVNAFLSDGQLTFLEDEAKGRLKEKLLCFQKNLDEMRELAAHTPIHEVIVQVLQKTGYGRYARALPGGEQRSANLNMLIERAMDFEKTSYRGLFNFVRYIEKLQKYEVDFGEVNLSEAGRKSVQIMTIHKSKGLEFPIVFVSGMGKQFNFQDANARLLVHPELGLGTDAVLPSERLIVSTVHKQMLRREILRESLGEELRVLYVALTRAKEKLILSGTIGKVEKQIREMASLMEKEELLLPIGIRMKAKSYWSYVLPALARHRCMDQWYHSFGIGVEGKRKIPEPAADFSVKLITASDLVQQEIQSQVDAALREEQLKNPDTSVQYDAKTSQLIRERFAYQYPYDHMKEIPVKVSVSELKKRSHISWEEQEESLYFERDIIPLLPRFISEKEDGVTGAARGTAYHRVMECLDYSRVENRMEIEAQLWHLVKESKLSRTEAEAVEIADVERFAASPLGKRMKHAAKEKALYREQPFIMQESASVFDKKWNGGETILVQGIIDAYFIEEDEIVLVDYKTDRLREGEEQKLIDLYHVQLEDYASALTRMLSKKVKEAYLYSFSLGKEIRLF